MNWYEDFLKKFFHDPADKPFSIRDHENRAKEYAEFFDVSEIEDGKYADIIASCMERSLLPKDIKCDFNEVIHPLSGEKLKNFRLDNQNCIAQISSLLKEFSDSFKSSSDKEKAFLIWRNLLEEIIEKIHDKELKKYFPILPADTRIPDHSLWEHLKITTAINASGQYQNNSLFLFTIGPVQSFISQARKTHDFYMGSFMLSYLTFMAIQEVIEKYGPTSIIYPDLYNQPLMDWYLKNNRLEPKNSDRENLTLPTIPNRFVAIIGTTNEDDIKTIASEIEKKITDEIRKAKDTILEQLRITLNNKQTEILQGQLFDFPQIYWVAVPWRKGNNDLQIDDLNDFFTDEKLNNWKEIHKFAKERGEFPPNIGFLYQLSYTALEKSMGARKNLREFEQKPEAGRKCSLCGERNVFFYRDEENPLFVTNNLEFFYQKAGRGKNGYFVALDKGKVTHKLLGKKEGLCALCFIKRAFDIYLEKRVDKIFENFSFPSVAEVACSDFKKKAKDLAEFKEYEGKFSQYLHLQYLKIRSLPKLCMKDTLEGSWFYKENLAKRKIEGELGISIQESQIEELKNILKKVYDNAGEPNPYYAVLYLDGDNMGRWLSGELLPEIQYAYNSNVWKILPDSFKDSLQKYASQKILTPAIHSAISTALRNYAIEFVRKIVEEDYLGKLIYAGGDDVLAFVNLTDLFDVMEKLRWAFSGHIKFENGKLMININNATGFVLKEGIYYLTMGKNATCSAGFVIAHYKEPLKIVVDKVFEMNRKAKKEGKDRFAICLMKHSGEERVGVAKWQINDFLTTQILKELKDCMNRESEPQKYISDGFIQKFKTEFYKLKQNSLPQGLINTELKRLITRAYNGDSKGKKDFVNLFFDKAQKLFWGIGGDIENFKNLLEISSFMNRGA